MTFTLAATEPARAVARALVRSNIERLLRREHADLVTILRLLEAARARIVAELADGTEFDQARAQELIRSTDREINRLRLEMLAPFTSSYRSAVTQGDGDMLAQARVVVPDFTFPTSGVSSDLLAVAHFRSADLVQKISEAARSDLNSILSRSAIGAAKPNDVAAQIGRVLDSQGRPTGVFGTLATQVERVHRTETSALYEMAGEVRQKEVVRTAPYEMRKLWISTTDHRTRQEHRDLNGATIPADEHFNYGAGPTWSKVSHEEAGRSGGTQGLAVSGPHDSMIPAAGAVNCRCTKGLVRGPRKEGR